MSDLIDKLNSIQDFFVRQKITIPRVMIVLGSGLSGILSDEEIVCEIPYSDIPYFRTGMVEGHAGVFSVYKIQKKIIGCMNGRFHFYEGNDISAAVLPVRAFAFCGARAFLLTNASGSLRRDFVPGCIVNIHDHINLFPTNPLTGQECLQLGRRFLNVEAIYDSDLQELIKQSAKKLSIKIKSGVYLGCSGPAYETRSEARMFAKLGGDIVGMSTVPEALALHHMGAKVVALSVVANYTPAIEQTAVNHSEVLKKINEATPKLRKIIKDFIASIKE